MEVIMLPGCEECQATKGHHKACQHGGTPNLSVDQTVWELKLSASFFDAKEPKWQIFHENKLNDKQVCSPNGTAKK